MVSPGSKKERKKKERKKKEREKEKRKRERKKKEEKKKEREKEKKKERKKKPEKKGGRGRGGKKMKRVKSEHLFCGPGQFLSRDLVIYRGEDRGEDMRQGKRISWNIFWVTGQPWISPECAKCVPSNFIVGQHQVERMRIGVNDQIYQAKRPSELVRVR
ncbi:hypothetical protein F4778DRAFT_65049 [Xylariomycetidae sp. FL2044]|nr:hypothetical protein F4778DRAFT_65049 [Xylariomycetidae sp. FL2044]